VSGVVAVRRQGVDEVVADLASAGDPPPGGHLGII
jgi:hypothetical protein